MPTRTALMLIWQWTSSKSAWRSRSARLVAQGLDLHHHLDQVRAAGRERAIELGSQRIQIIDARARHTVAFGQRDPVQRRMVNGQHPARLALWYPRADICQFGFENLVATVREHENLDIQAFASHRP